SNPHRIAERFFKCIGRRLEAIICEDIFVGWLPVAVNVELSTFQHQAFGGAEGVNAFVNGLSIKRDPQRRQIMAQYRPIRRRTKSGIVSDCRDRARKQEYAVEPRKKQRLRPAAVTDQHEPIPLEVVEADREVTAEMVDEVRSPSRVGRWDDLGVAASAK